MSEEYISREAAITAACYIAGGDDRRVVVTQKRHVRRFAQLRSKDR